LNLDLLPVINAVCEEVGLFKVIDDIVDWYEAQTEVSPEALTAGLVMNFLTEGNPPLSRGSIIG
jgi:hypothetical protein